MTQCWNVLIFTCVSTWKLIPHDNISSDWTIEKVIPHRNWFHIAKCLLIEQKKSDSTWIWFHRATIDLIRCLSLMSKKHLEMVSTSMEENHYCRLWLGRGDRFHMYVLPQSTFRRPCSDWYSCFSARIRILDSSSWKPKIKCCAMPNQKCLPQKRQKYLFCLHSPQCKICNIKMHNWKKTGFFQIWQLILHCEDSSKTFIWNACCFKTCRLELCGQHCNKITNCKWRTYQLKSSHQNE